MTTDQVEDALRFCRCYVEVCSAFPEVAVVNGALTWWACAVHVDGIGGVRFYLSPEPTSQIEAERDAAVRVLRQLVAADDERKRLDGRVDLLTPETHREWEMAYERADQAFDDGMDAARRLLADNGAGA